MKNLPVDFTDEDVVTWVITNDISRLAKVYSLKYDLTDPRLQLLHTAARHGAKESAEFLLSLPGANIDALNSNQSPALNIAIMNFHYPLAQFLLEKGANPNIAGVFNKTVLHHMAGRIYHPLAKQLILAGANIHAKTATGNTPLHIALHYGNNELATLLVEHGADVLKPNQLGQTPFQLVSDYSKPYWLQKCAQQDLKVMPGKIGEAMRKSENIFQYRADPMAPDNVPYVLPIIFKRSFSVQPSLHAYPGSFWQQSLKTAPRSTISTSAVNLGRGLMRLIRK